MLKQILATSALIAVAAVSIQSAQAADSGKFRQLVVEASGTPSGDQFLKQKKFPTLVVQQGQGIPTPGGAANGGNKGAKFIVAPSQGIPTQTADAGNGKSVGKVAQFIVAPSQGIPTGGNGNGGGGGNGNGNGNGQGGKVAQFIVAPSQGIATPAGGGNGRTQNAFPTLASASGGIATPINLADAGGDPAQLAGGKAFPLIVAAPTGISAPAGNPVADTGAATADAGQLPVTPQIDQGTPAASGDVGQPAIAADTGAPAAPAAVSAVQSPKDLYSLLAGRGYGVEILKRDQYGNLIFYVTIPGQANQADLLLVDATYGKVLERKHVAAYDYDRHASNTYDHPANYAPSYAAADSGVNCDHGAGY